MDVDVDVEADNGGWGRPRPKFEDLVPDSDPEPELEPPVDGVQGGSDDSTEDMTSEGTEHWNDMQIEEDGGAPTGLVSRLVDYPLAGYDGAPCGELNQLYANAGHQVSPNDFYTVWDNGGENCTSVTCLLFLFFATNILCSRGTPQPGIHCHLHLSNHRRALCLRKLGQ